MSISPSHTVTSEAALEPEELGRVRGALLGVIGGELGQRRDQQLGFPHGAYPVSGALLDICHAYVGHRGHGVPVEVAARHQGVHGPAWLLAVALVRRDEAAFVLDTLELAAAAGVPRNCLSSCVAYVELAVNLMAGWPTHEAITTATEIPIPSHNSGPHLVGEPEADGLAAGVWAVSRAAHLQEIARGLATRMTPGVRAAATGLVGLRDGDNAIPTDWRLLVPPAAEAMAVAPGLVRLHHSKGRTNGAS